MSWDHILFDMAGSKKKLVRQIDALLEYQRTTWKAFRDGEALLSGVRCKVFRKGNAYIVVQSNPGRRKSTSAKVDPVSVSSRPCFLCAHNLPSQERGIGFDELVVLPNPYPVLPRHCTIPTREHSPQRLEKKIEVLLKLSKTLGSEMLIFYNGPRCGASAPDHFHFQACNSTGVPLLDELFEIKKTEQVFPLESFGRKMLVCRYQSADKAAGFVRHTLEVLSGFGSGPEEPMVNVISVFKDGNYMIIIFPRAKHRPECYFAEGDFQIAVSPAALEMAGVLVVADPDHFERLDEKTVLSIYQEVSLDTERFAQLTR